MNQDSKCALNLRDFPVAIKQKCKAKAALHQETLNAFVIRTLTEATKDIPEPKRKSK